MEKLPFWCLNSSSFGRSRINYNYKPNVFKLLFLKITVKKKERKPDAVALLISFKILVIPFRKLELWTTLNSCLLQVGYFRSQACARAFLAKAWHQTWPSTARRLLAERLGLGQCLFHSFSIKLHYNWIHFQAIMQSSTFTSNFVQFMMDKFSDSN